MAPILHDGMLTLLPVLRWTSFLLLTVVGCLGPLGVWAKPFEEADVVRAILRVDPQVQQADAWTRQANAQVDLATPRWRPSAYYTLEHFGKGQHLEQEHELGAGATFVAPHQNAARAQARLQAQLNQFNAKRRVHDRVMQGLRRFYRIVALQEQLKVLTYWKEGLHELHRVVKARVLAGESPGYEQLRIDLELRHANSEIRVAQAQQSAERRAFAGFLGIKAKDTQFVGALLPDAKLLEKALGQAQERPSLRSLAKGRSGMSKEALKKGRGWVPSLSVNAGLRMRHDPGHRDWGFGVGLRGAFPSFKRVRAVHAADRANLDVMQAKIDATRFDSEQAARQASLLCLSLIQERARYVKEVQQVLEPLEAALQAEYREGQRDVIGLMTVLQRSMDSRRYRLELATLARAAELDYRDATGVFEP